MPMDRVGSGAAAGVVEWLPPPRAAKTPATAPPPTKPRMMYALLLRFLGGTKPPVELLTWGMIRVATDPAYVATTFILKRPSSSLGTMEAASARPSESLQA